MDKNDRRILRMMAWERAKGELKSMLHTFYDEEVDYAVLESTIDAFIDDVESNGKHE